MKGTLEWQRAVYKLSGELLAGEAGPLSERGLLFFAREIKTTWEAGVELAVVPGGGNLIRGADLAFLPPTAGHAMGMLATLINGVALREALANLGVPTLLMSAVPWPGVAGPIDPWQARTALAARQVVILAGGTGSPFVTTDTAAVIRALALGAEGVLKGSKVDGVYSADPTRDPTAKPIPQLTPSEYLSRGLRVLDQAAVALAGEHGLPIRVFRADQPGALLAALQGERGSLIA